MKFWTAVMILAIAIGTSLNITAQEDEGKKAVSPEELNDKVSGIDENVTTLLTDVAGLKKIKISGYIQTQFEKTESAKGFSMSPYDSSDFVQGRFRVRRGRLKATYDAGLTQYVLQIDATNAGLELKDAYVQFTEPWLQYFTLTTGVFNRPNYEVEYSSSQRESMERSQVVRTLYPGERDLGAMLTIQPGDLFKLQIAGFNNTFLGTYRQNLPNFNNEALYYMFRLTKELSFTDLGLGIDLGVHARIGNVKAVTNKVIMSENNKSVVDSSTYKVGDGLGRNWFGVEAQIYYDFLGGMKILGEYITGSDVDQLSTADKKPNYSPIRLRNFSGFYAMLVKNISPEFQVAVKYDSYNPNTKIDKSSINDTKDLSVSTLGFGLHNYTFDNVRISFWYDMITTTTSDNLVSGKPLLSKDPIDNLFTLRFQYKF